MKKLLGIVVLGLLWCNVGFADAAAAKKACRDIGFEPGTEQFSNCALKLMLQEKQSDQSITLKQDSDRDEVAYLKAKKIHDSCVWESYAFVAKWNSLEYMVSKYPKFHRVSLCHAYTVDKNLYPSRTSDR